MVAVMECSSWCWYMLQGVRRSRNSGALRLVLPRRSKWWELQTRSLGRTPAFSASASSLSAMAQAGTHSAGRMPGYRSACSGFRRTWRSRPCLLAECIRASQEPSDDREELVRGERLSQGGHSRRCPTVRVAPMYDMEHRQVGVHRARQLHQLGPVHGAQARVGNQQTDSG